MHIRDKKSTIRILFRSEFIICMFIIIAVFAAYWQLPKNSFISFDDDIYVTKNIHVQAGFSLENIKWAFTTFHAFNWHPVVWFSHMMDYQLFGLNASMHHLMSLLFHITNSVLLFIVLRSMTNTLWPSAFVAVLFAVHPLHVESVAWVSERKDLLSTLFLLLTTLGYYRYVKKKGIENYIPVFLLYALGLMSKPMLVTLPFVFLLFDLWPIQRIKISYYIQNKEIKIKKEKISYLILEKIPLFILSAASSVITFIAQKEGGIVQSLQEFPLKIRLANTFISYIRYIGKMFIPVDLAFYYPYPADFLTWKVLIALLIMIFITIFAIKKVKAMPFFLVGWLWYVGTLIPAIGLVQVATQSMADRYTYIPLIGLFIIIAWGSKTFYDTYHCSSKLITAVSAIVIIVFMSLTWKQVRYWENDIQLYSHDVKVTIDNPLSNYHLGLAIEKQGKIEEAIRYYTEAVRIKPDFLRVRNSLGNAFVKLEKYEDAIIHYTYALTLKKNYADGHFNLGFAFMHLGKTEDAVRQYKRAIEIDKDHADAHYNLGLIMSRQQHYRRAVAHFIEVIRINPADAEALNNLGNLFLRMGKTNEAIHYYQKAVSANPNYEVAQQNLDVILKQMNSNKIQK